MVNEEEENGEEDYSTIGSLQSGSSSPQSGLALSALGSVENIDSEDAAFARSGKEQTPKHKGHKHSQSKTDMFEGVEGV